MLTINVDLDDRLTNGQIGTVNYVSVLNGRCETIFVLFDDVKAGNKRKNNNNLVPIERAEARGNQLLWSGEHNSHLLFLMLVLCIKLRAYSRKDCCQFSA